MNNRKRALAVLNYMDYDRLPIVHFGFLRQTLERWCHEGHITIEEIDENGMEGEALGRKLGFDFNWYTVWKSRSPGLLQPQFERKILDTRTDGSYIVQEPYGAIVLRKENIHSIPAEMDHILKDRTSWEREYLPKLEYSQDRLDFEELAALCDDSEREYPIGIYCSSLYGEIRNWFGIYGLSYIAVDDEGLYDEIINTVGELCYRVTKRALSTGEKFDFGHFWEDICFKNGPLVDPEVFSKKVGPHYRKITELLNGYGINIVSVDCDGCIDALVPIWLDNGVNTMFPIEVGTWGGSIKPWREKYGRELRGVGGMDKRVLSADYAAVDAEIERLRPLVESGGYIPCPDHRLPHDVKWENVRYYCERMRQIFC